MDLLHDIKMDRMQQGRKQACGRSAFHTVGCIVRTYGLDEGFLMRLAHSGDDSPPSEARPLRARQKQPLDIPPFVLLTSSEFKLTAAILDTWDNPYLPFAHSPEEILYSASLFEAAPSLTPRDLLRADFETLLLDAHARVELEVLEEERKSSYDSPPRRGEVEAHRDETTLSRDCRERIRQLRAFVLEVDRMEPISQ